MTNSNILIYQSEDGQTKVQTRLEDEKYPKFKEQSKNELP